MINKVIPWIASVVSPVLYGQGVGMRIEPDYDDGVWQDKTSGNIAAFLAVFVFVAPYFIAKKEANSDDDLAAKYWKWWAIILLPSVLVHTSTKSVEIGLVISVGVALIGYSTARKKRD